MKPPTHREARAAWEEAANSDSPTPIAYLVDENPHIRAFVAELLTKLGTCDPVQRLTLAKALFVGGVELGMRIGIARGKAVTQ